MSDSSPVILKKKDSTMQQWGLRTFDPIFVFSFFVKKKKNSMKRFGFPVLIKFSSKFRRALFSQKLSLKRGSGLFSYLVFFYVDQFSKLIGLRVRSRAFFWVPERHTFEVDELRHRSDIFILKKYIYNVC